MELSHVKAQSVSTETFRSPHETFEPSATVSFYQIREIREAFEQATQPLRQSMGSGKHQALLTAMYEGTEQLFNKNVTDFEVTSYLESLKDHAKTLHHQGISHEAFRSALFRQSQDSIVEILRHI